MYANRPIGVAKGIAGWLAFLLSLAALALTLAAAWQFHLGQTTRGVLMGVGVMVVLLLTPILYRLVAYGGMRKPAPVKEFEGLDSREIGEILERRTAESRRAAERRALASDIADELEWRRHNW